MENFPGKLLAIDHGEHVLGFATCDRIGVVASPLTIRYRTSKKEDFAFINQLIAAYDIVAILVGMPPRPPDFVGHSQSDTVRLWAQRLVRAVSVPVYFWDEGLTTVDAAELLGEVGSRHDHERMDAHAAAVMLQSFLDALRDYGAGWPEQVMALVE